MDTQLEQPSFIEKSVGHVFRESEGGGHRKFFWGFTPRPPHFPLTSQKTRLDPPLTQTAAFFMLGRAPDWKVCILCMQVGRDGLKKILRKFHPVWKLILVLPKVLCHTNCIKTTDLLFYHCFVVACPTPKVLGLTYIFSG